MKSQFNNQLLSSFNLWFNNRLLNNGQGYTNHLGVTGYFQPESSRTGYCWAFPYKALVFDSSASGALIMSGVYNQAGQFLTRQSGIQLIIFMVVFLPQPILDLLFREILLQMNIMSMYQQKKKPSFIWIDYLIKIQIFSCPQQASLMAVLRPLAQF